MKRCCRCKEEKQLSEFGKNKREVDGHQKRCFLCARAASAEYYAANKDKAREATKRWQKANKEKVYADQRRWRKENPEKIQQYARKMNLKYRGLTPEKYQELYALRGGRCDICNLWHENLVVDHDHSCCSGKNACGKCFRGLLCNNCNAGIGMLKDSELLLRNAIAYLQSKPLA